MAWTKKTVNRFGLKHATETKTLPSSATVGYSSVIDFLYPDARKNNKYFLFTAQASAVSGTNLDIALYGAMTETGTKFLLLDAIVADITDTTFAAAVKDINAYPAPYYFIAHTADANESANTITYQIVVQD